jgi:adenylate cyclase
MTREKNIDRHGSVESSSSWRSSDTVRGPYRSRPPVTVKTSKDYNHQYVDARFP